jgi:hypothetical protein
MGNIVQVYLDTTPPILTLHYPPNATQDSTELISITSNENLSINQEIVIVDSLNISHYYTFSLQNDKKTFIGNVSFHDFPKGIATLYVRLFDEVHNKTSTYKGTIVILDPKLQSLKLSLVENVGNLKLTMITQNIVLSTEQRKLILEEGDTNV